MLRCDSALCMNSAVSHSGKSKLLVTCRLRLPRATATCVSQSVPFNHRFSSFCESMIVERFCLCHSPFCVSEYSAWSCAPHAFVNIFSCLHVWVGLYLLRKRFTPVREEALTQKNKSLKEKWVQGHELSSSSLHLLEVSGTALSCVSVVECVRSDFHTGFGLHRCLSIYVSCLFMLFQYKRIQRWCTLLECLCVSVFFWLCLSFCLSSASVFLFMSMCGFAVCVGGVL